MGSVKNQIMSLFKTKDYSKPKLVKTVYRSGKKPSTLKIQKESEEENIIKSIRILFKLKNEMKQLKKS